MIVDNCSRDDTYFVLNSQYTKNPEISVIRSERNGGYGYGNNYGANYAISKYNVDYVVIANPDILIEKEDFFELFKAFKNPKVAVSTATMKSLDGSYKTESKNIPTYLDDIKACLWLPSSTSSYKLDYLDDSNTFYFSEFIPGSFFIIRSDVFKLIGGFDENIFLFCEERVIGIKIKNIGYKQVILKDKYFLHAHSTTIKKTYNLIQTNRLMLQSRLYFEKEYMHISNFKYCLLALIMKYF